MQPYSVNRKLKMFPKMQQRSKLTAKLTPSSALWQQLPSQFRQVVQPRLWKAGPTLTLMVIATACLTALFVSLRYQPMRAGYWMAMATKQQQDALKQAHKKGGYDKTLDCMKWWADHGQAAVEGMTQDERDALVEQAAKALFLNPPISPPRKGGGHNSCCACMCLRMGKAAGRHIDWDKGYPSLILQDAGVTDAGVSYPRVTVPVHQLVAWLFLGPKPAGKVVCHNDLAPQGVPDERWETTEKDTLRNQNCFPKLLRCLSKNCVSPLCVYYGTQSDNAKTGREWGQLIHRKQKKKRNECVTYGWSVVVTYFFN